VAVFPVLIRALLPSIDSSHVPPCYTPVTRRSPAIQRSLQRCISHSPQSLLSSLFWPRPLHSRNNLIPQFLWLGEVTYTKKMVLSTPTSLRGILPPPSSELESMCKCMITDVVYSKFARGFETYERNTGKRHPLQPDVVAGTKRGVISEELLKGSSQYWEGMCVILSTHLCLTIGLTGAIKVGTPPVSRVYSLRLPPSSNLMVICSARFLGRNRHLYV
jgi:hypothetical protein